MGTIKLFQDKVNCCACGACENVCPKNAISLKCDDYGFLYPQIDDALCVKCRQCISVCRFQNGESGNEPLKVYAAAAKDDELLNKSASGGAFAIFAQKILEQGGAVFGCAFSYEEGKLHFSHVMVDKPEDVGKLQGSKYVKSNINHTYREARSLLKAGRKVLFSGTPCQIDGLLGFLGKKNFENLVTVDIICHGVPSEKLFQDYIALEEKRSGMTVYGFDFRSKQNGWGSYSFSEECQTKEGKKVTVHKFARRSSYYWMFLNGISCRDNCYSCKYACGKRISDLTIGDFWGIEKVHPEHISVSGLDVKKGVSCILANSEKGLLFLKQCENRITLKPSSFEAAALQNGQLNKPTAQHSSRKEILELYRRSGYAAVDGWYRKHLGIKFYLYLAWDCIPISWRKRLKAVRKRIKA